MLIYSYILFKSQKVTVLSLATLDSPYILGFLFTLVAIFNVYVNIEEMRKVHEMLHYSIPQIGFALSTTVVGLIGRHLLLSFDETREKEKKQFIDIANAMEHASVQFSNTHSDFLGLINNFVSNHKDLLNEEKNVVTEHIKALSKTLSSLKVLESEYPKTINSFSKCIENIQKDLSKFSENYLPDISNKVSHETSVLFNNFKQTINSLENILLSFEEQTDLLKISIDNNNDSVSKLSKNNHEFFNKVQLHQKEIVDSLSFFKNEINEIDELISTFIDSSKRLINKKLNA